jgi:predicted transcriptional regulator
MAPSPHTVLVETVSLSRESGEPVSSAAIADALDAPEPSVAESLDSLCAYEFLSETDGGYQPTVTATELLALDVEFDEILVCEVVDK